MCYLIKSTSSFMVLIYQCGWVSRWFLSEVRFLPYLIPVSEMTQKCLSNPLDDLRLSCFSKPNSWSLRLATVALSGVFVRFRISVSDNVGSELPAVAVGASTA